MQIISLLFYKLRRFLPFLLAFELLGFLPAAVITAPKAEALVACAAGSAAQNNLTVSPSHGKAFYIDTGINPKLDAGYVGYIVTNTLASARNGLWVELTNFGGGKLSLANPDDKFFQLDNLSASGASGSSSTAYLLLKATGASTVSQTHDVKIWDRRPDLNGATLLYGCTYTFNAVKETIKASANKVNDGGTNASTDFDTNTLAIESSTASPKLGETMTITVEGSTGQIGAGGAPDYDVIWFTPAAISSWPTRVLRLTDVSITFSSNDSNWVSGTKTTYNDRLLITSANGNNNIDGGRYVATYTFRLVGTPRSSIKVVPVAQIASGTQMKHSDVSASGATLDISLTQPTIPYAINKTVVSTSNLETRTVSGELQVAVPYKLEITSTASTVGTIDEIVDIPSSSGTFKEGSAKLVDVDNLSEATISDPTYLASEANLSPRPIHFIGPFKTKSARSAYITYKIWLPAKSDTYQNQAYALLGDLKIGANASAIPVATVTTNGGETVSATISTASLTQEVVTEPANNVDTATATLNGVIDPNGAGGTAIFHYGTSPSLSVFDTATATTPASGTLTGTDPLAVARTLVGLTSNTTYYFRATVGSIYGDILSFKTSAVTAAPTVTTNNASGVDTASATLNATVSPNNTTIFDVGFVYKLSGTVLTTTSQVLSSATGTPLAIDGTATDPAMAGSSPQDASVALTGLSSGTYYFYARICTAIANNGSCDAWTDGSVKSFSTSKTAQVITFDEITSKSYGDSSFTVTPTAPGGSVTLTSLTTSVCTATSNGSGGYVIAILAVGECQLEANQAGNSTYNPAPTVTNSFQVGTANLTITAQDKSKNYSGVNTDNPTNSYTISGFVGSDTATVSTPSYTYSGRPGTNYASSSTAPTNAGSYSITPSGSTFTFADPNDALNYQIVYVSGVLTINSATLIVTADDKSSTEGGSTPTFTARVTGFIGSDTGTVTTFSKTFSSATYPSSSTAPTTEGVYVITPSSATVTLTVGDIDNYTLSYATGNYTITASNNPAPTLNLSDTSTVYNTTVYLPNLLTFSPDTATATVTYYTSDATKCQLSGTNSETLTALSGTGTCTITATKSADSNFRSATDTATVTLQKAPRTLSFDPSSSSKIYGETVTVSASPSAGTGTITYSLVTSTHCTLSVATLTATKVGSGCVVSAQIAADDNYQLANSSNNYTLTITTKTITIRADNKTIKVGQATPTFTSTVSGLVGSETATVTSGTYTFGTGGIYSAIEPDTSTAAIYDLKVDTATVTFSGDSTNYSPTYTYETGTYTISNLTSQTIVLDNSALAYNATLTLSSLLSNAGSGSGTVTYTSNNATICPLSGANGITLTAASGTGSCVITATKAADITYASASDTATITLSKINQTISFTQPTDMTVGGSAQSLTYSASSTLSVTITSNSVSICTYSSNSVSAVSVGTCSLTASQNGDDNYNAAVNVTVTFLVNAAASSGGSGGGSSDPTPNPGTAPAKIKLKPTITWDDPEDIDEGVPLENRELDAICSVPGTLTYSPPLGTILPGGIHTLSVTCTPTDSENYEPVSKQVKINVIPAPPSAISHRLIFMPTAKCLTPSMAASLERFLDKVAANTTEEFSLQVYFSGGFFNEDPETPMTEDAKARYQCLCQAFLDNEISAQIFTGIFSGPTNTVEIIVSWVRK